MLGLPLTEYLHPLVTISHDAKLPEILWKFRRAFAQSRTVRDCPNPLTQNTHFYPITDLQMWKRKTEGIQPLSHRDAHGEGQTWTKHVFVYGDDTTGCIKLVSGDGTITKIYTTVTHSLGTRSNLTIFKGPFDCSCNYYNSHRFYR